MADPSAFIRPARIEASRRELQFEFMLCFGGKVTGGRGNQNWANDNTLDVDCLAS
jgi:hypothetical protein